MSRQSFEAVAPSDPGLIGALKGEGLPAGDLDKSDSSYFVLRDDDEWIGYVGLEGAGPDALLRSLVVGPPHTGKGYGRILVLKLEDAARARGIGRLHLLTATKTRSFFEACGYRVGDRSDAPVSIAGTTQFRTLCPADAPYMTKAL